ncbi:MAG: YbhB/YbcL family Raf kinase inhibitor-like protein [Thermoanaerobaculia bacterium]|jgi:Raf kinase inhibitor-like YbhB/YbcL family protein
MASKRAAVALLLALFLAIACARDRSHGMKLFSPAFAAGAAIPKRHACDGENVSPPLAWTGAPAAAKAFAVVCDDPDARNFTHWVLINVPAGTTELPEGLRPGTLPAGAGEGANDFGGIGWGGPCPPSGEHRYEFRLYALDAPLSAVSLTKQRLETAMDGHVLAEAKLVGTYRRAAP